MTNFHPPWGAPLCFGVPVETPPTVIPPENDVKDRKAEVKHFREVCHAFATYEDAAQLEIARIERNLGTLSEAERRLLTVSPEDKLERLRSAVAGNQAFLNLIISQDLDLMEEDATATYGPCPGDDSPGIPLGSELKAFQRDYMQLDDEDEPNVSFARSKNLAPFSTEAIEPSCAIEDSEVSSLNMFKVRSTLKQFAREWSTERAEERNVAFLPLLNALSKYLPLDEFRAKHGRRPWVLCPGSGLGRLPFDAVCRGYSCQGNEFSYFMLLGSNFMLNHALEPKSLSIQPFCLNSSNRRKEDDHLQTILIPDVSVADASVDGADFSMCAGDFLEVYAHQTEEWDAVLTCFFLDTAKNVIQYVHVIANILSEGSLWANFGPLLYHFADSPTEVSIELAWDELRSVIQIYFDIVEEEWVDSFYTTPPRSMLQALYHCVHFSAIRNGKKVPSDLLPQCLNN